MSAQRIVCVHDVYSYTSQANNETIEITSQGFLYFSIEKQKI